MSLENKISHLSKGLMTLAAGAALYNPAEAAVTITSSIGSLDLLTHKYPYTVTVSSTSEIFNKVELKDVYSLSTPTVGSFPNSWAMNAIETNPTLNLYTIILSSTATKPTSLISTNGQKIFPLYLTVPDTIANTNQLMWNTKIESDESSGNLGTGYVLNNPTTTINTRFTAPIAVPETNSIGYLITGLGVLGLMRKRN